MKRAVSTVDASAASSAPLPHRGKLKRCKSAFANLKRLGTTATSPGGGGAESPSLPPPTTATNITPSPTSTEDSLLPRWRQHASSPDVMTSGSAARTAQPPVFAATWSGAPPLSVTKTVPFRCHGLTATPQTNHSSGRRLFSTGGGGAGGVREAEECTTGALPETTYSSVPGGAPAPGLPARNSFSASLTSFSPVPEEQEGKEAVDGEKQRRCHWQKNGEEGDDEEKAGVMVAAASGGRNDYLLACWADSGSGSPGFSIVGFGDDYFTGEDEEDEEQEPGVGVGVRGEVGGVVTTTTSGSAWGFGGGRGGMSGQQHLQQHQQQQQHQKGVSERFSLCDWENSGGSTVGIGSGQGGNSAVGEQREVGERSPSAMMVRLQRRFEEMLLVSNVAT